MTQTRVSHMILNKNTKVWHCTIFSRIATRVYSQLKRFTFLPLYCLYEDHVVQSLLSFLYVPEAVQLPDKCGHLNEEADALVNTSRAQNLILRRAVVEKIKDCDKIYATKPHIVRYCRHRQAQHNLSSYTMEPQMALPSRCSMTGIAKQL